MATTTPPFTLGDYLAYDPGSDRRYELVAGDLLTMPSESDLNNLIAMVVLFALGQVVAPRLLRRGTEIVISEVGPTVRIPDLMVLTPALAERLQGADRSIILLDMPPPALVVEVVSPGKPNEDRDYRSKRSEYQSRGIPEYWIIDPQRQQITLLTLVAGLYREAIFTGNASICSPTLPTLALTAAQVFNTKDS
jgi:Uma2 family endonuclease